MGYEHDFSGRSAVGKSLPSQQKVSDYRTQPTGQMVTQRPQAMPNKLQTHVFAAPQKQSVDGFTIQSSSNDICTNDRVQDADTKSTTTQKIFATNIAQEQASVSERKDVRTVVKRKKKWQPALLYSMAAVIFLLGLGVAFSGFRANSLVAAQVKSLQKASGGGAITADGTAPPSAEKPSAQAVAAYTVEPDMPRYITVPKLGVFARVLSMGVNDKSQLDAPKNIHDAGWYNDSSKPGLPGALLIDGHSGIGKTNGIFHNAGKLTQGDAITIERGDRQKFTYKVVSVRVLQADSADMSAMVPPADNANEGLNLITCTGRQIPGTTSLDQRVLIRAVRSSQ